LGGKWLTRWDWRPCEEDSRATFECEIVGVCF
jgi:hypothetical protein